MDDYKKEGKEVRVTYETGIETVHESPRFFFSDYKGGFSYVADPNFSHYVGSFIPYITKSGWNMYKIFHSIIPYPFEGIHYRNNIVSFFYPTGKIKLHNCKNGFHLEVKGDLKIPIECDPRAIYDFFDMNRFFEIEQVDDCIVIWYKRANQKDHFPLKLAQSDSDDQIFIAIKTELSIEFTRKWVKREFILEKKRNSGPLMWHVFHAISLISTDYKKKHVGIGFASNKSEAISHARANFERIEYPQSHICSVRPELPFNILPEYEIAGVHTYRAFDKLSTTIDNKFGLYAGLPWFFQWWSRDEAISVIALILVERLDLAKDILLRHIRSINEDGLVANRYPHSILASADATGWVCKRIHDMLDKNENIFTPSELDEVYLALSDSYEKQTAHQRELRLKNSSVLLYEQTRIQSNSPCPFTLMYSGPLHTWMDTGAGYDEREGFCIEIQSLWAAQLSLLIRLSQKLNRPSKDFLHALQEHKSCVKNLFYDEKSQSIICDRLTPSLGRDDVARPNVLLAYYIYSDLFKYDEWSLAIHTQIPQISITWGNNAAITTISQASSLFKPYYAGENNASYHRGDVWFYVNALASIVLHDFKLEELSEKLLLGIKEELISHGSLASIAEVSSAKVMSSDGCELQLWSCALFLEALYRLKRIKKS
jgi:glycogen debranching enzyme